MNVVFSKELKINLYKFYSNCHSKLSLPILVTIICGYLAKKYFISNSWRIFFVNVLIMSAIYFISMWTISMNKYEKILFIGMFNNKLNNKLKNIFRRNK
jgi:ABC-type proline/glycine betaine transport system permease subunit